ncbi:synaptogenesis protein syg-2-like [Diprion similis]|uniref:synaptogenesis protein syg-2-like n=1 Tax=Diprion similis TaxID=362088 RepID=UPI001EF8B973|nr:synaptogenesis protein syg-2-like [Diprion similis]
MRCLVVQTVLITAAALTSVRGQGIPRTISDRRGGPPLQVRAVQHGTAVLPCDLKPPQENDSAILVVWYKNDITPIYSYDMRPKRTDQTPHWKNPEYLNERATFKATTEPAHLNINRVEENDEGDYRCRVDFTKSPTRNSRVQLTVIVPPHKPNILDDNERSVPTVAGPYVEGGLMRLTCVVFGGRPQPVVRWWRGEMLLDSEEEPSESPSGPRRNTLVVTMLTRADLHAEFTCQASNNNISQPVSASVRIEMYLKPMSVQMLVSDLAPLSAEKKYSINCMTYGSRPPAKTTWYLNGKSLDNYSEKISPDMNMTMSTLSFKATLQDHKKKLTCRAENNKVHGGVEEANWELDINFVPVLRLELGSNMNPEDIEEGDDVYFECKVHANPEAYKVVWKHNGNVIQNNAKNGVFVQRYDLAFRKVNRSQAGNYTCVASNVEGDGTSNSVELKIMYKPLCLPDQKLVYGVARHEEARVICRVEAYPAPHSFRWAFNNTEEMVDVPQARFKNSTRRTQSILTYRPVTEMDYGMVLCWASNTAGIQKNACMFHIIPAQKPESPYNCTLTNQTTDSLSVECTAGFDGGQQQYFFLEVFDQHTAVLQANRTSKDAAFTVAGLEPGKVLKMVLYAANSKGRSKETLLEGFTLKVAEKQTGTPIPFEFTPLLGVLIGVITALVLVTLVILGALKLKSDRRAQRPGDLPLKKATAPSAEELYDTDDRNPDVVPTNKDSDYQLTGSTAGTPLAVQTTPDGQSATMPAHQINHLQGLPPTYQINEYNNYPTLPLSGEVTYAELCLARPTTLATTGMDSKLGVIVGGKPYTKEATVYACIDHTVRQPTPLGFQQQQQQQQQQQDSGLVTPGSGIISGKHHPREVVTVRTPLISTQESCV